MSERKNTQWLIIVRVVLFLLLFYHKAYPQQIYGSIQDPDDNPLPFTSIYVKGTTIGTTSNAQGDYTLALPRGEYSIQYSFLGYKSEVRIVKVTNEPVEINIVLSPVLYTLSEVTIDGTEDPAYGIMRKVIAKKKYYRDQIQSYSCQVYVKGIQRLKEYPKKILGSEVNLDELIDTASGIIYLSESVSEYHFKAPDQYNEIITSSKYSGDSKGYTFNQASSMEFDWYDNIIDVGDLNARGYVSPFSGTAFFYYHFELLGSEYSDGQMVYRIKVTPKRKTDPVFTGEIFINDSLFNIAHVNLYVTKDNQLNFLDTLRIEYEYKAAGNHMDMWVPFKKRFRFYFSFLGFKGDGEFTGVFSNYKINKSFDKNFFNKAVLTVEPESNKRDSLYWQQIRPVPLTLFEQQDYKVKDSLNVIRNSESYRDSVDRISNRIHPGKFLFTGYDYTKSYLGWRIGFDPLIQAIQFNTIQGLNLKAAIKIQKEVKEKYSLWNINPLVQYGISDKTWLIKTDLQYLRLAPRKSTLKAHAGRYTSQFNANNPVFESINTFYSLFYSENYLKLYRKDYIGFSYNSWIQNKVQYYTAIEMSQRQILQNRSLYSFKSKIDKNYTSNNPFVNNSLYKDRILLLSTKISWNPGMEYYVRPDRIIHTGSKWPVLQVVYDLGIPISHDTLHDFHKVSLTIRDEIALNMIGALNINIKVATSINHGNINAIDLFHFDGNQTVFAAFSSNDFLGLNYYERSTSNNFLEAHFQHNFGGLLFNKIPWIRKLHLNEYLGFNALLIQGLKPYQEYHFSISKLDIIRVGYVFAMEGSRYKSSSFLIGLAFLR